MARARSVRVDLGDGMALEYLKGRGTLRLHGGDRNAEVPLTDVLEQLGVQAADVVPSGQYLLFAGDAWPAGGVGDLVAVYTSEAEGRDAFQRLRLLPAARHGWAQLVAVRANGRIEPVCWFGREPSSRPTARTSEAERTEPPAAPKRRLFRGRRGPQPETVRVVGREARSHTQSGAAPAPGRRQEPGGPDVEDVSPMAAMLFDSGPRPAWSPAGSVPERARRPRPGQRR